MTISLGWVAAIVALLLFFVAQTQILAATDLLRMTNNRWPLRVWCWIQTASVFGLYFSRDL